MGTAEIRTRELIPATKDMQRLWTGLGIFADKMTKGRELSYKDREIAIKEIAAAERQSYAYWAGNHIEAFLATDYYPLRDERTGEHKAGIRRFQIDPDYPEYLQLFEVDGFTEWEIKGGKLVNEKNTPYKYITREYCTGTVIESAENYSGYPVVPWYVTPNQKSLIKRSIKDKISMYNLTETLYFDDFIRTSPLYWAASGGNIEDRMKERQLIESTRIATSGKQRDVLAKGSIDAVTVDFPYQAKEALRMEIEAAIFRDAKVVNTQSILAGRILVGAVRMAARAEDTLVRSIERFAKKAIHGIMRIAGVEGEVKFSRTSYTDDLEIMQQCKIASDAGVPPEAIIPVMPLFADRVEETMKILKTHSLAMDEAALLEHEKQRAEAESGSVE